MSNFHDLCEKLLQEESENPGDPNEEIPATITIAGIGIFPCSRELLDDSLIPPNAFTLQGEKK